MTASKKHLRWVSAAIDHFWVVRTKQSRNRKQEDQGNRSAVTGGKQMDRFLELFRNVAKEVGIPDTWISIKGNHLPGYFRSTKDWDFIVRTPSQLIAAIEFKSQVGSFGNNFNNRTEEALGSALDLWTNYEEQGFKQVQPPWLGYVFLLEHGEASTKSIRVHQPHFSVRPEFEGISYLDRYAIFCEKLMQKRHYNATALITSTTDGKVMHPKPDISIFSLIHSFAGFLEGKIKNLKL